jgi:competence protein ComEA
MRQALYVLLGVLAGFFLAGALLLIVRAPAGEPIALQPAPTEAPIAVHVIGAVPRPGLYEFAKGARVQDAIDAAGGLLTEADEQAINLAALLEDGQQVNVPYETGEGPTPEPVAEIGPDGLPRPIPTSNEDLVNINTATLDELDSLPGIGPTTAQKIIDYRIENGPFLEIEDIMNVSGIGPATFENLRELITV